MPEKIPASDGPATPPPGRIGPGGLIHPVDLMIMTIILSICGALYYVTTTFEEVSNLLAQNIPPEFFPRLVMLVIGTLLFAESVREKRPLTLASRPGRDVVARGYT